VAKKHKPKEPFIPVERHETIRKEIVKILQNRTLSAKDISAELHILERDVYEHLAHIHRSMHKTGHHLTIIPAECLKCHFVFTKRERLKTPGKCPACHEEHIQEAFFSLSASSPH